LPQPLSPWSGQPVVPSFAEPASVEQQIRLATLWHDYCRQLCARKALDYQGHLRAALGHAIHRGPSQSLTACNLQWTWIQLCSRDEKADAEGQLEGYLAQAATDLRRIYQEYLASPGTFDKHCMQRWGLDLQHQKQESLRRKLARELLLASSLVDPQMQVTQGKSSLRCYFSTPQVSSQQPLRALLSWFKACRYRVAVRGQSCIYSWG